MQFNNIAIGREEMLVQKLLHESSTTAQLSSVNVMHHDCINGPIGLFHRQVAKIP
jgi:hypothetical protein